MKRGSKYRRAIYCILDAKTKRVYVGLTANPQKRYQNHCRAGTARELAASGYPMLLLTKFIHVEAAKRFEAFFIDLFRSTGYLVLNKAKAGGIGGDIRHWTFARCKIEASKYQHRSEFYRKSSPAYHAAQAHGFMETICAHMPVRKPRPVLVWTYDKCHEEAQKYNSRSEFNDGSKSAYLRAYRSGWLDEICDHMSAPHVSPWTFEACRDEALKYRTRADFYKTNHTAYMRAWKNGWLAEILSHLPNRTAKRAH